MDRATALAGRVVEALALFGRVIASGTLSKGSIYLQLDPAVIASALEVSQNLLSDCPLQ
jgi:hypothetical protein